MLLGVLAIACAGSIHSPLHLRAGSFASGVEERANSEVDPEVTALLRESLVSPQADVRASALQWIVRDPHAQSDDIIALIFASLKDGESRIRNQALANMAWIYERRHGGPQAENALTAIVEALKQTSDRSELLVALDVLRGSAERGEYDAQRERRSEGILMANPAIQALAASRLADAQSSVRPELLRVVEVSQDLQAVPPIVEALGAALRDDNLTVRSNAADILVEIHQRGRPAVRNLARSILEEALRENDPNVQLRVSRALDLPIPPRKTKAAAATSGTKPAKAGELPFDFNFFTAFVQPLFLKKYGNEACVDCHTPEANATGSFRILAPSAAGRYTLEQSQTNFASVLAVIVRADVEKSGLLLKPLNPRAPEGKIRGVTHDGGVFWDTQYDPDFEMLDDWLKGAKLEVPPDKQLNFAYFAEHVEPIFSTPGPDGFACVNCHSTHAIFHLESPETREGKLSVEQLQNNYQAAHRVIDETAPASSFILRKPTSLREGEPGGLSHAGGVRWPEKKDSWQYKALITWMGTRNVAPE